MPTREKWQLDFNSGLPFSTVENAISCEDPSGHVFTGWIQIDDGEGGVTGSDPAYGGTPGDVQVSTAYGGSWPVAHGSYVSSLVSDINGNSGGYFTATQGSLTGRVIGSLELTFPAASSLATASSGDYVLFRFDQNGQSGCWFDVDSGCSEPNEIFYPSWTEINVTSSDTDDDVAAAFKTWWDANMSTYGTATRVDNVVTIDFGSGVYDTHTTVTGSISKTGTESSTPASYRRLQVESVEEGDTPDWIGPGGSWTKIANGSDEVFAQSTALQRVTREPFPTRHWDW